MLKARIATGVVLAASFLFVLLHPNSLFFYLFCGLALSVAAWEWAGLFARSIVSRVFFTFVVSLSLLLHWYFGLEPTDSYGDVLTQSWVIKELVFAVPLWLLFLFGVVVFPRAKGLWSHAFFKAVLGFLVIQVAWSSLLFLRELPYSSAWIALVIALVAFSDIGAYFAGKRFGQRKLALQVSPGKTWEGFIGGMLAALFLAAVITQVGSTTLLASASVGQFLFVALLVSSISVVGDLSMSMLKRIAGIKDSGSILPGHGGVLDRIDGMLAAVPIFAYLVWALGW